MNAGTDCFNLFNRDAYHYDLPERLIASVPVEPRDASRLLVLDRKTGVIMHRHFRDLPEFLSARDVLIVNNAKVLKARLLGHRLVEDGGKWARGGKVEFLMLEEVRPLVWEGAFHASCKHRPGIQFEVATPDGVGIRGRIVRGASDSPQGTVCVEFDRDPVAWGAGTVPLPPYIQRQAVEQDAETYQTLYAKYPGAAAAPTAGFHFTEDLIRKLRGRGVGWEELTLFVGLGTFRPVKVPDIRAHAMHEERFEIASVVARRIASAKQAGHRLVAVGSTVVRALESAWEEGGERGSTGEGRFKTGAQRTALFLYPGGEKNFRAVDALITNFHLPCSTLLMLVCAFAGREKVFRAYEEAVRLEYRFYSYGDAMLIL